MARKAITKSGLEKLRDKAKEVKKLRAYRDVAEASLDKMNDAFNKAHEEFKKMAVEVLDLTEGGHYRSVSVPRWLVDILSNL